MILIRLLIMFYEKYKKILSIDLINSDEVIKEFLKYDSNNNLKYLKKKFHTFTNYEYCDTYLKYHFFRLLEKEIAETIKEIYPKNSPLQIFVEREREDDYIDLDYLLFWPNLNIEVDNILSSIINSFTKEIKENFLLLYLLKKELKDKIIVDCLKKVFRIENLNEFIISFNRSFSIEELLIARDVLLNVERKKYTKSYEIKIFGAKFIYIDDNYQYDNYLIEMADFIIDRNVIDMKLTYPNKYDLIIIKINKKVWFFNDIIDDNTKECILEYINT